MQRSPSAARSKCSALGLLFARTRYWTGIGLIVLTICVTPANLNLWLQFTAVRLMLQPLLLVGIWWSTRRSTPTTKQAA